MYHLTRRGAMIALTLAFLAHWLDSGVPARAGRTVPAGPSYEVQPEANQPVQEIGRGYFWLKLSPGQSRTIRIVIKNIGTAQLPVRDYLNDSVALPGGGIDFTTWGKHLSGTGTWITVQPKSLLLAPGETRRVYATIHVPKHLAPGQYVAGVALEDRRIQGQHFGSHILIDLHYRQVLAVVITLPGRQVAGVRVAGVTLAPAPLGIRATVTVWNTGNMLWKGKGALRIGGGRSSTGSLPFTIDTLLPGAQARVAVPLPYLRLQPGAYNVQVRLFAFDLNGPISSTKVVSQVAWQSSVALSTSNQGALATPVPTLVLQPARPVPTAAAQPAHLLADAGAHAPAAGGSQPISPLAWGAGAVLLIAAALGAVGKRKSAAKRA